MADTSQSSVYYAEESTWATPASGTYNELRVTGESLSETKNTVTSEEIRSDRQTADVQQTAVSAEGDIDFEFSFATFDDLFEGALLNRFDGALNISGSDISVNGTNNNINSTSTDLSSVENGQWIKVGGFSDSTNNGYFRIDSGSTNTLSVQYTDLNDETSGNTITVDGNRLVNGTEDIYFTMEKEFGDAGDFYRYPGTYISSMDMSIEAESLVTGSFSVMAQQEEHNENQTGNSVDSANTNAIINATDNIKDVREGGSTGLCINSLDFSYDNNLRERPCVGQLTTQEFGTGTISVTGSIEAYFEDQSLYQKYLDYEDTDLSFRIEDDGGASYILTFNEMKYTDGEALAEGQNSDIFASLDFTAFRDKDSDATNNTFQIDKFTA